MHARSAVGAGRGQEAQPDSVLVQQACSCFGQIGPGSREVRPRHHGHTLAVRAPNCNPSVNWELFWNGTSVLLRSAEQAEAAEAAVVLDE
jgi:hypothetical protein